VGSELRVRFRHDMAEIDTRVVRLFALVCESVAAATESFQAADGEAARTVADRAGLVDELECELEEVTEHLLLTQTPMSSDMRYLVTVLRIVPQLERCGDLAEHVAQRAASGLRDRLPPEVRGLLGDMGERCTEMWAEAQRAWAERDDAAAAALDAADDRLDALHDELTDALVAADIRRADLMQATLVGRFYERLGDHAVHLADRIRYVTSGQRRSHRPARAAG
jgi:phosphate transport system protein